MTDKLREAAEQVLEWIKFYLGEPHNISPFVGARQCADALRAALAEQPAAQEPRAWVGLSEADKLDILRANGEAAVMYLAEAKLREKNAEQPLEHVPFGYVSEHNCEGSYKYQFHLDQRQVYWDNCKSVKAVYTAPHPTMHPFLVRDLAELIGSTVPDVCNALEDMGIEPRRSTNAAVTPDEALAVARRLAQPTKQPLTDEELGQIINANWGVGVWQMARSIEAAHGIK